MKAGIYDNISIEEYHANKDWVSSTGMKHAKKSLREYWYYLQGYYDTETKPQFDFGNAFELALLDPKGFDEKVANEVDVINKIYGANPDTISPRATKIYKDWFAEQQRYNKYVINAEGKHSFKAIEQMLRSCYMDKSVQKLVKNINYQVSLFWEDKETGLKMKARPDFVKTHKNVIVDLKTAVDGSPETFSKVIGNNNLWLQAAMQIEGVLATGLMSNVDAYYWLVVEKEPPYNATIYHFTQEDIEWALDQLAYYKKLVSDAVKNNAFVGYTQQADNKFGILTAEIPLWVRNDY